MSPRSRIVGPVPSTSRQQRVAVALLALALTIVGAACSPATEPATGAACPAAVVRGTLEVLGSDLGLFDSDNRHLLVDWPDGYTTRDVVGVLSLIDPAGGVVARVGDAVEIPGGELRVGEWHACGDPIVRRIVAP